ncbi:DUF5305 family protein [Halorhabdus sp. BNX81]|uniref:DUF5305 domain-containing protein n=1 Tax=Halorhabdus sp. BNX81 TaxID=2980181 RepID=UPI0023DD2DA3|nr:DUF5305 family protein [Halorhabdus sp. BNX81]WEL20578.1 putative membrane protein [Halorhabdus sp. BNX81]
MRDRGRGLRIRRGIADNFTLVVAVVVMVGAVGGYLTYTTHAKPGTETVTETVSEWESAGEFHHHATVVNGTAAFETGERLENRSAYFTQTTPRLAGALTYTYTATDGGDLSVTVRTALELRSAESQREASETVYWEINRQLNRDHRYSLSPGETIESPFSLNVSGAAAEVERIDENLGGTPGELELEVVAEVALSGTRNGKEVNTTRTYRLPIDPSGGVYGIEDPGTVRKSDKERKEVTVQATYGPLRKMGGPVLLIAGLVGVFGLGYATRTGRLSISDREREWLAFRSDRASFDEWISTGAVSTGARGGATAETDSLAGLVNVAIDTDSRVIEDTRTGAFYVFADGQRFRFEPPAKPDREREHRDPLVERVASHSPFSAGEGDTTEPLGELDAESESGREQPADEQRDPDMGTESDEPVDANGDEAADESADAGSETAPDRDDEPDKPADADGEGPPDAGEEPDRQNKADEPGESEHDGESDSEAESADPVGADSEESDEPGEADDQERPTLRERLTTLQGLIGSDSED